MPSPQGGGKIPSSFVQFVGGRVKILLLRALDIKIH